MSVAPSFAVLLLGRFLAGAAAGLALVTAPIYASEIASPEVRGALASLTEIFMGIGILFGYISNNVLAPLPRSYNWRVMLGLSALPALIIFVLLIFIPETPRWLVMRGRQGEARKVLLMTSNGDVEVAEQRLAEIECAAKVEESSVRWGELLSRPSPCVLRMLFAAIGVNFFQQASGIQAVTLYAPKIFVRAGMKKKSQALAATSGIGVTKVVFIFVAILLADKCGRRPLLLTSIIGMGGSLLVLSGSLWTMNTHPGPVVKWVAIVSAWVDEAFYGVGIGPIAWVYASEIFPLRLRGPGMSVAVMVNRMVGTLVSMTFLSLNKAITIQGSFLMYALICALGGVFCWFALPETKGRTLEEVQVLFGGDPLPKNVEISAKVGEVSGTDLEMQRSMENIEL
ncbi:probable polyol transporter 6 [Amborella trichopoda]|uniref:probable polyol transporter 6 n=1 Tax=Amborella trichopoda TaxID=13333 RepID=UPI0009BE3148|nr:probable polyol transporter 6 [Amborella trichopoda]|eukprot:XP_020530346.1 probable polyol transporter 6 [Amborella trichopoda]